jgi:apolipoprotein N-acyltransferase
VLYDALALLGGLLLPFAFAPFDIPLLAVVALVLLFAAWSEATPGQAWRRGFWFGLGQFGVGTSWVYVSMHNYGSAGVLEAGALTAFFSLFWAMYPAFAGWLAARFCGGSFTFKALAAFPAAWVLAEWLRSWFPTGFPWLQIGYSQMDTPLAGLAPVFGVYGVGWAVAVLAGLLLVMPRWTGGWRQLAFFATLGMIGVGASLGQVNWTRPAGEPIRVALLQGNVPQDQKWQPEFQRATLAMYAGLTREHWDAKLVVWPETAVPAFYQQVKDGFIADLAAEARSQGTDLLVGVPYYDAKGDRYYNAVAALGSTPGFYFKRHLVPFGEYVPLRPLLGWVLDILQIPLADFASGDGGQAPLVAAGQPLAASICYEDIFGHESLAALPQAAFLVNVTNDAWFGDSMAPHQHAQMARMRALETGRWMLRATNTGVTAIIDPKGTITARAPLFQKTVLTGTVVPMQGWTPYIVWGDGPIVVGVMALLAGLAWRRRSHPKVR